MPSLYTMYEDMKKREEGALAANVARQARIENIFETQMGMYKPGGAFEKASLAELGKVKTRDVGATAQRDISRGMYGIRPYEQEWESSVGAPARLKLEDIMQQRRSAVLSAQAGFLERIETPYPDYGPLMQAAAAGGGAAYATTNRTGRDVDPYGGGKPYQSLNDWMKENLGSPSGTGSFAGGTSPTPTAFQGGGYVPWGQKTTSTKVPSTGGATAPAAAGETTGGGTSQMTAREMMNLPTFAQYKAVAEGQGMVAGSEEEWLAVKKRL